jgi:hypothetical protein
VREEPLGLAQEGLLALHAPKLLEEGQRQDLRVREALERGVALAARVEETVDLVYETEENDDGLFRAVEVWGMVWLGHPALLWSGTAVGWPPFYTAKPHNTHLAWAYVPPSKVTGDDLPLHVITVAKLVRSSRAGVCLP